MPPPSILIIGAGIASPVLATFLLLSPNPPHITILERSPSGPTTGQNIDVRGAGISIIRKLGLETAIRASTTHEEGVHFVDEKNCVFAVNPADKSGTVQTGTSDVEILRGTLARILYERCREVSGDVEKNGGKGVEFLFGEKVHSISQDGDGVDVLFTQRQQRRRFDIVVGADGIMSSTRRMLWSDDEKHLHQTGMFSAFFSIPNSPTDSLWRRWFTAPKRRHIMIRPSDRADRSTVTMFLGADEGLSQVVRAGIPAQKKAVEERVRDAGWCECPRLIDGMWQAEDFYFGPVALVKMSRWWKGRVVLLGDAAYCPSPLSGQGTTLALLGAYHLAGCLMRHGDDYTTAFTEYDSEMRPIVEQAQKKAPTIARLIGIDTVWGVWMFRTICLVVGLVANLLLPVVLMLKGKGTAKRAEVEDYGFGDVEDLAV